MKEEIKNSIKQLSEEAASCIERSGSQDALRYSQAALNLAHVLASLAALGEDT